jgi:hypothetical protein
MGTRSTIKFYAGDSNICSIYNQFDGYIEGFGYGLAKWLKTKTMINGINDNIHNLKEHANGMGCLAAQFVATFKDELGGLYMTSQDNQQEFNYEVRYIDGQFQIKVGDIFTGTPQELLDFKEEEIEEDQSPTDL